MGSIISDVKTTFLMQHPEQENMLKAFLFGFDVTYAEKKVLNNTTLFAYLLKPEEYLSEAFGIDREVILAYSPFDVIQPRALQATNMLFDVFPFKNRVDTLNCFIVSKDYNILEQAGVTSFSESQSRSMVPFVYDELVAHSGDSWYIRNQLRNNFYDADLFGYTLPLRDETSFFGRQQIIARYVDAIKRCENRGIFGVRKTGKTSLLFKIDRLVREQRLGFVFFYDCKSPSYRMLHWNELLGEICSNIAKRLGINIRREYDEKNIIKSFRYVVNEASKKDKKIVIIFDEIEYISFKSPLNPHWHSEFIDFWQTIWSVQSIHRNLVFILSGVNPSVTEIDTINGIQNPLFSIVQSEYLQGLSEDDARTMVRTLGRRMGVKFDYPAITLLYNQYNGHPMLLRLACSYINRQYSSQDRPITIKLEDVKKYQEEIDIELLDGLQHGSDLIRLSVQRQHICYMVWHTVFLLFHFHLKALYFLHRLFFRQLRCRKLAENIFFRDQGEGLPIIPTHLKLTHIVHMGHRASRSGRNRCIRVIHPEQLHPCSGRVVSPHSFTQLIVHWS